MVYTVALVLHSYLRWIALALAVLVVARSWGGWMGRRAFTATDNRVQVAFMGVVDTQLLVGLALYVFLSPVTAAFFANAKAAMKDSTLRFFGVEHLALMLLALVVVHAGRGVGKRKDDTARHRITAITTLVFLVLVFLAVPWPGRVYGRALFRGL